MNAAKTLVAVTALAGVLVVGAVAVTARVAVLRRRAARWEALAGQWWEITAPARPTPGAAVAACQAIGGVLRRTHRGGLLPRRVALELLATPTHRGTADDGGAGVRVGVWVPPRMPSATLVAALRAALPGAVITPAETGSPWPTPPPTPTSTAIREWTRAVSVVELSPRGGIWAPLIDPATTPRTGAGGGAGWGSPRMEAEPLRAVFAALTRCATAQRPGEVAGVQLVVRAARTGPASLLAADGRGVVAGLVQVLGRAVSVLALELLDIFTPGRPTTRTASRTTGDARRAPVDPVQAAQIKARDAKRAAGPHLAVTLRVAAITATGVPDGVRRARLAAILGGYDLVSTPLHIHPTRAHRNRQGRRAGLRLAARLPRTWFMATTAELAALWHLPADPARHGLPAPPARDGTPPPVLPQLSARGDHGR